MSQLETVTSDISEQNENAINIFTFLKSTLTLDCMAMMVLV